MNQQQRHKALTAVHAHLSADVLPDWADSWGLILSPADLRTVRAYDRLMDRLAKDLEALG